MNDIYENPLVTRYASKGMAKLWSPQSKYAIWRDLWLTLAEEQQKLGLEITDRQIEVLEATVDHINFPKAAQYEKELHHDVMAHLRAWGDDAPEAKAILHLGATSSFVTDNTELIQIRDSLNNLELRLLRAIHKLRQFCEAHSDLPCLGFTHLQPAQPTTLGKRATLWCWDLMQDYEELKHRSNNLRFRGLKGATGTQASFLELFKGNHLLVKELEQRIALKMGFAKVQPVTGQTYSRKVDSQIIAMLSGIAQTCHKFGTDIRLLQHRKEVEEPFAESQVGSSAMPYKRNPMYSERLCSLSRFIMTLQPAADQTAATQWLERTLDDSAIRRIIIPQAFLAADACLMILNNIIKGLNVYPKIIAKNLREELPFLATERILMLGVQAGKDRQELHERLRVHCMGAVEKVRDGGHNDLIWRIRSDSEFSYLTDDMVFDPSSYIGRSAEQVQDFLTEFAATGPE
jgi:adenylosuccinate lyase